MAISIRPVQSIRSSPSSDTEILSQLLHKGYDWRVRPPGTNLSMPGDHGPVVVNINMLIRSISKIDDVNMEYSAQLTFREEWVDGRLAFGLPRDDRPDHIILTAGQQIWMPDTFFQNEKQARKHEIDKPNVLIRIHKDGRILYSVRISLVLSCPMYLQYYPMDVQTCLVDMASYAYTDSDIEYQWKSDKPVQLKDGLESSLPSFQLTNVTTGYCTSKTNTGTYSCLRTILTLRRQFSYYLLQLYIPSSMLVIVSWVSFWLDRTAVPARVTLGVTTLLTMTTQTSGINAKLPPVSYSKAIDIWCGACLAFIFSALLEFACVTYISSRMFYKRRRNSRLLARLPMFINNSNNNKFSSRRTSYYQFESAQLISRRPSLRYPSAQPEQSLQPHELPLIIDEQDEAAAADDGDVWIRRKESAASPSPCTPPYSPTHHHQLAPPSPPTPSSDGHNTRKISICLPSTTAPPMESNNNNSLLPLDFYTGNNSTNNRQSSMAQHSSSSFDRATSALLSLHPTKQQGKQQQQQYYRQRNCLLTVLRRLPPIKWMIQRLDAEMDPAKRADLISRVLFPLVFALFNAAYWFRYLKL